MGMQKTIREAALKNRGGNSRIHFGHVEFEIYMRHSHEGLELTVGYTSPEFGEVVWAELCTREPLNTDNI